MPIAKDPNFANSEVFQYKNPEGSFNCQSGRVQFLQIRKGPVFGNPERSRFCQSGRVLNLAIRKVFI